MTELARAKKSLGQHWLVSNAVQQLIVKQTAPGLTVLEIGPGTGFLTAGLLNAGFDVVAVEKDERLAARLQNTFANAVAAGQLKIVTGDILRLDPHLLGLERYQIAANLPYYLTGRFLRQWLPAAPQAQQMILMLQKEVAERLVWRAGKGSRLSLAVAVYGQTRYLRTVGAGNFRPAPKVDSALVLINRISRARLAGVDEEVFFDLLRRGFSQKRKQLKNNLGPAAQKHLAVCQIPITTRPEDLSLEQWLCLARQAKTN